MKILCFHIFPVSALHLLYCVFAQRLSWISKDFLYIPLHPLFLFGDPLDLLRCVGLSLLSGIAAILWSGPLLGLAALCWTCFASSTCYVTRKRTSPLTCCFVLYLLCFLDLLRYSESNLVLDLLLCAVLALLSGLAAILGSGPLLGLATLVWSLLQNVVTTMHFAVNNLLFPVWMYK